jgi:hypothetical protein
MSGLQNVRFNFEKCCLNLEFLKSELQKVKIDVFFESRR